MTVALGATAFVASDLEKRSSGKSWLASSSFVGDMCATFDPSPQDCLIRHVSGASSGVAFFRSRVELFKAYLWALPTHVGCS